jgi:hypothetical protein
VERRIGFFPLFLAVGCEPEAIGPTCYAEQWRVKVGVRYEDGKKVSIRRRKGEFPNLALLIFEPEDVPEGVFTDYQVWHGVLNAVNGTGPDKQRERSLFKPSWTRSRWHAESRIDGCKAQLLVPSLDSTKARCIWVRNKATQMQLLRHGFANVQVRRVPVSL